MWLMRHDRDCGDLYGVLPVVNGLPAALTKHYDRNPPKKVFKGRVGYIKDWVLDDREDNEFHSEMRYLRYPPSA
eukprot:7105052-Karenia_brevis.AAC.1